MPDPCPQATITEGDAENLPANWTGKFDRYTSAGSIEYWPHPQMAIDEAARILRPGGKAMIIGPIRATNPVSRFFADLWYSRLNTLLLVPVCGAC